MKVSRVSVIHCMLFMIASAGVAVPPGLGAPVKELKAIGGKDWTLTSLKVAGSAVELPSEKPLTLKVDAAGRVSGRSAVNRFFGGFEFDGKGGCKWDKGMGATRMAGPPALMKLEQTYFEALAKTTQLDLSDGKLVFSSDDQTTVLVFGEAAPDGEFIEGQVIFKADPNGAVPSGTTVKVSLLDASLADAPAKTLGSVAIDDATHFPVKFRIPYDKNSIRSGMRYVISARIEDAAGLRYINDTSHPVFRDGMPPAKPMDLVVIKVK